MNVVRVRVTGTVVGVGLVFPYDHKINPDQKPLYRVPTYLVNVNGRSFFSAVRFGFRGHFEQPWDPHRQCEEGIEVQREVAAQWNAIYSPHSFGDTNGLPGGFRIRSDQVYIHEGAQKGNAAGTLGCVEISGVHDADDWNRFLATVAQEAGVAAVGKAVKHGKVLVTLEAAARPSGLLVGRVYWSPSENGFRRDLLPNWETASEPWSNK